MPILYREKPESLEKSTFFGTRISQNSHFSAPTVLIERGGCINNNSRTEHIIKRKEAVRMAKKPYNISTNTINPARAGG